MDTSSSEAILVFASETDLVKSVLTALKRADDRIIQLEKEVADLRQLDAFRMNQIVEDRRRIAKLEHPYEPKDPAILDDLHKEMIAIGRKQVDFATAARMVKRSKSRMLQLKAMIGQDMRFMLVPSESHSQKVLIRLR